MYIIERPGNRNQSVTHLLGGRGGRADIPNLTMVDPLVTREIDEVRVPVVRNMVVLRT